MCRQKNVPITTRMEWEGHDFSRAKKSQPRAASAAEVCFINTHVPRRKKELCDGRRGPRFLRCWRIGDRSRGHEGNHASRGNVLKCHSRLHLRDRLSRTHCPAAIMRAAGIRSNLTLLRINVMVTGRSTLAHATRVRRHGKRLERYGSEAPQ